MKKAYISVFLSMIFVVQYHLCSYANDTVSISGSISNKSFTNIALNDVFVEVKGTKNIKVKTDRGGNYIIAGLPKGGSYTLAVSKNGYIFSPETKIFRNLQESKINQIFVDSEVETEEKPIQVVWRVREKDGQYSIIDIIIEGVSMTLTYRNEYTSYLQTHTMEELIERIKQQTAELDKKEQN